MESQASHRTLQPGEMLNWYRIERILGRGGFGVIYLATDTNLDHQVAIKEYIPSDVAHRAGDSKVHPITEDHSDIFHWGMDRFIKEARNLVKFKHPNIVRVMSVFQENNTAYMVMEFEEGEDLRSFLRKPDSNNEATLKQLILPVSKGLAEVHRHGFIHRDIKPANILVRKDGSPVLLDFGSARNASKFTQQSLTALVSVGYAPLEQYNSESDEQQGPWTDIYALGGTLYYAISGNDPIESTRRGAALLNGGKDPLIAAEYLGEGKYTPAFLRAIDWALQFGIADRPQTLSDWIPALLTNNADPITGLDPGGRESRGLASQVRTSAIQSGVDTQTMNELSDATVLSRERRSGRAVQKSAPVIDDSAVGSGSGLRSLAMLALLMSGVALGLWFLTSQQQADQAAREDQESQALIATQTEQEKRSQLEAQEQQSQANRSRELQKEQEIIARQQAQEEQAAIEEAQRLEQQQARERAEQLAEQVQLKEENEIKAAEAAQAAAEEQARLAAEKEAKDAELAAQKEAERLAEEQKKRDAERAALDAKRLAEARQERRLKQAITAAQNSLGVGDLNAAQTQLGIAQGINAEDARVQTFGFVLQAALDEHNLPVSDADFDEVTRRFDALRRAIESKDTEALDRLAISSRQSELFKSLMRNFERLDVSIAGIRVRNADKSITGSLRIDALVRANGDRSSLSEKNATRTITSRRVNGGWSKIEW